VIPVQLLHATQPRAACPFRTHACCISILSCTSPSPFVQVLKMLWHSKCFQHPSVVPVHGVLWSLPASLSPARCRQACNPHHIPPGMPILVRELQELGTLFSVSCSSMRRTSYLFTAFRDLKPVRCVNCLLCVCLAQRNDYFCVAVVEFCFLVRICHRFPPCWTSQEMHRGHRRLFVLLVLLGLPFAANMHVCQL
jgi:hypothetical protein